MAQAAEESLSAIDDQTMSNGERSSDESSSTSEDPFLNLPRHNPKKIIGPSLQPPPGVHTLVNEPS